MSINGIGAVGYQTTVYQNNRTNQKARIKSFENTAANIVIHGIMGEKNETGDTVVGSWAKMR